MANYIIIYFDKAPVWPDAGIKSNPNFPIIAQKVTKAVIPAKVTYFKVAKKLKVFGLLYNQNVLPRT